MQRDECIRVWRGRLGRSFRDCLGLFERFYRECLADHPVFGGFSPKELVEWQANARGREAYTLKGFAQNWIQSQPWRYQTKQVNLSKIASFFLHNLVPWPVDMGFHFTSDIPPVEGRLGFEEFRRILLNCNKMYRAALLMMGQMLAGEGELVYVNVTYPMEVLEHLTKNDGLFKLTLPGRKRNRNKKNFYTVLSTRSDWADAMKQYIKSVPNPFSGCLFRNSHGDPLTGRNIQDYFHARAVETGVVKQYSPPCSKCQGETTRFRGKRVGYKCRKCGGVDWASEADRRKRAGNRTGVNPHEIRDLMRSRWRASGAETVVAEFLMQHDVDVNLYDKMKYTPGYVFREYRKALPWLNILSENPEKVSRSSVDVELEEHRRRNQKLNQELLLLKRWKDEVQKDLDMLKRKIKKKNR